MKYDLFTVAAKRINPFRKKTFLVWLIQIITMPSLAQDHKLPQNLLGFETGVYSHGLAGISYARSFDTKKNYFYSVELSGGLGIGWAGISRYAALNSMIHLGKKDLFFMAGIEGKCYDVSLHGEKLVNSLFSTPERPAYNGFSASPVIGVHVIQSQSYHFKMKLSSLLIFEGNELVKMRPSIGFTFGHAF